MPNPQAGQFRNFLESIRAPVAEMAGLSADAVLIYAQQNLAEFVLSATASHQCAVALGIVQWRNKADASTGGPPLTAGLSVRVWTPEVVLTDDAPTTLDVAEVITRGLHGLVPPEGSPGKALIPQFTSGSMAVETRDGTRWLVADLTFSFAVTLRRPPADAAG